jgi:hypothetical protein
MSSQTFEHILLDLGKPIDKRLIRQREGRGKKQFDYVEWETVCDLLNAKAPGWTFEIKNLIPTEKHEFVCHGALTIAGVTRENVGTGDGQHSMDTGIKGAVSDCIKRCAVLFGLGLQLYRSEQAQAWAEKRLEMEATRLAGNGNGHTPPAPEPAQTRAAEVLGRIRENAPEVAEAMEPYLPDEPDDVLEAVARDDEREEEAERAAIQGADERLTKDELATLRAMWQASKLNATSDLAAFAAAFSAKPDAIPRRHLEDALSWISEHKRRK